MVQNPRRCSYYYIYIEPSLAQGQMVMGLALDLHNLLACILNSVYYMLIAFRGGFSWPHIRGFSSVPKKPTGEPPCRASTLGVHDGTPGPDMKPGLGFRA